MKKYIRRPISLMLMMFILGIFVILPANFDRVPQIITFADLLTPNLTVDSTTKKTSFKKMALRFEVNRGQTDAQARFIARTSDSTLFLTTSEAVLRLPKLRENREIKIATRKAMNKEITQPVECAVIRLRPTKCNREPRMIGIDKLPGVSNYFIGNDPRKWQTNVEAYAKVKYENVYPGIDLIYYGNEDGEIEYDFKVAPGANPDLIAMSVEGASRTELDQASGDLILSTTVGRVRQHAPRIYQEVNGKYQEVVGHYRLLEPLQPIQTPKSKSENSLVAFEVGDYDKGQPLVIDPVVVYSTLLGGAAGNFDGAKGVAVDGQGNAYITGNTESSDFPTRNPLDGTPPQRFGASSKAFIAKFAPDGSLIYSTFLGGNDSSSGGSAIAVDTTGNVYVAGSAGSGFPIKNAFQSAPGSTADAFIIKLNGDGTAIIYSSYLGGNQGESVRDLKLDAQNNVYLLGEVPGRGVANVTFPTVNPTRANYGGGDSDIFLSVVSANGTNLLFSTFVGGNGDEEAKSVSVSSDGNQIAISGASTSTNLTTGGIALQASEPSCDEFFALAFIIYKSNEEILYREFVAPIILDVLQENLTCLEGLEELERLLKAVAAVLKPTAQQQSLAVINRGGFDVYVLEEDANTNRARVKSSFGGSRDEFVAAGTKDSRGAVYIAGDTTSTDLPTVAPTQTAPGGVNDNGFVVIFAPDTYDVLFATYLGGDGFTLPESIAVDAQGNIFVGGVVTTGTTFPISSGAFQRELKGRNDAFLVKYSPVAIPTGPDFTLSFASQTVSATYGKTKIAADITRTGGFTGNVTISPAITLPKGIIMVGESVSTTENRVNFKLKVKGSASTGSYRLSFAAKDDSGKTRTASFTLNVQ